MFKRILIIGFLIVIGLGALAYARGPHIALAYLASQTEKRSLVELTDLLVPAMEVHVPDSGEGPFPLVVQMHGCAGLEVTHLRTYAALAKEAGYASVIVASNGPRGFDRDRSVEEVCQGRALLGQERAADILVAIAHASKQAPIDQNRIVLAGWSHGAWSVMDFLTYDLEQQAPPALSSYDGPVPNITGAILFYPYCGFGTRTPISAWAYSPDVLALIAEADTIVDPAECHKVLAGLQASQHAVETVRYPAADHAFDHASLPDELAHWYDPEKAADARQRYRDFLIALE